MKPISVMIIGVGGLGTCMVREALERRLHVSVLVRNRNKLEAAVGHEMVAKLDRVVVGDGADPRVLDNALPKVDVVLSGRGADPYLAHALAEGVRRNKVGKLCWPAGTTNVLADDGVTLNYKRLLPIGDWVEGAYRTHAACINAIKQADIDYVFFCAGRMASVGGRSPDVSDSIRINRDAGPFVSYEDAAWVMLEAATTTAYDLQLVSAATKI